MFLNLFKQQNFILIFIFYFFKNVRLFKSRCDISLNFFFFYLIKEKIKNFFLNCPILKFSLIDFDCNEIQNYLKKIISNFSINFRRTYRYAAKKRIHFNTNDLYKLEKYINENKQHILPVIEGDIFNDSPIGLAPNDFWVCDILNIEIENHQLLVVIDAATSYIIHYTLINQYFDGLTNFIFEAIQKNRGVKPNVLHGTFLLASFIHSDDHTKETLELLNIKFSFSRNNNSLIDSIEIAWQDFCLKYRDILSQHFFFYDIKIVANWRRFLFFFVIFFNYKKKKRFLLMTPFCAYITLLDIKYKKKGFFLKKGFSINSEEGTKFAKDIVFEIEPYFKEKDPYNQNNVGIAPNKFWIWEVFYIELEGVRFNVIMVMDIASRYVIHYELITEVFDGILTQFILTAIQKNSGMKPDVLYSFANMSFMLYCSQLGTEVRLKSLNIQLSCSYKNFVFHAFLNTNFKKWCQEERFKKIMSKHFPKVKYLYNIHNVLLYLIQFYNSLRKQCLYARTPEVAYLLLLELKKDKKNFFNEKGYPRTSTEGREFLKKIKVEIKPYKYFLKKKGV